MTGIQDTIDYIRAHREQSMQSLMQLCSITSISTLSDHRPDMESAVAVSYTHLTLPTILRV